MDQEFLIALGSNLGSFAGDPAKTLAAALKKMAETGLTLKAVSRFFETPCFPAGAGPDYVNAAAIVVFQGSAQEVLDILHTVEAHFGRERKERWGMRCLDLDLLAAGNLVLPDAQVFGHWQNLDPKAQRLEAPDQLILPHPRLQDRAFVLVPLCDVAPGWQHPLLSMSATQLREDLPELDRFAVQPL